jgi:fatty-acyl-CoA synthase
MSTFNIGHILAQNAQRFSDHPGIVTTEKFLSWTEVNGRVNALACSLAKLGIGPNDRVLVQARNSHRAFEIKWACFKLGATWVPVNYRLMPPEIAYMARHSSPKAIMFDDEFHDHRMAASEGLDSKPLWICLDERRTDSHYYEDLVAKPSDSFAEAEVESDHPAWFFYTSGTTGRPKAAILTHGQLAFVMASQLADMFPGVSHLDTSLVIAPLSHGAGVHALAYVARGATQVILTDRAIDPATVWKTIAHHRVTNFFGVPTLIKTLVEHPSVDLHDHSSLRYVNYGGAPMLCADQEVAVAKLGKVLVQHYGLGEFTANITVLPPHLHNTVAGSTSPDTAAPIVGTCGFARTGVEIGIFDTDGKRLPAGEPGEIRARGQAAFIGYYNDPEATSKAFRDGWFHTGDIGYLDMHGFLFITGRASDMYISGGLNVYPREIEEVILTDDRVDEVAVVGFPHPKWGESGVAVIVPKAGYTLSVDDVAGILNGRIAKFKHPRQVVLWPELPKSGYGKILKREILQRLAETCNFDQAS